MAEKFVKASKSLNKFLRHIVGFYLKMLFDLELDIKGISDLKPPYIVLANHVNFWDPFILSICIPEPIYFVTSDAYFRSRLLKRLLRLVGAIPKIKFVNDAKTIRSILEVRRNNGIIGIFPEGRRNWDGQTLPLLYPSAKLIKSLNIPVVSLLLEGACLAFPRWAAKPRKGKIRVSCTLLLDSAAISEMSVDDVYGKITESLDNNEYGRQKLLMNIYKGKKLAERLELFLFLCPHCHAIDALKSRNNAFQCQTCGYQVVYDKYGFLKNSPASTHFFDTPQEWNKWQLGYLERFLVEKAANIEVSMPLFRETDVLAYTGKRFESLKLIACGTLEMYTDKVVFTGASGKNMTYGISQINGENIQFNNKLEFYCDKVLYRFSRSDKCFPAYKWVKAIEKAKNLTAEQYDEGH